MKKLAALLFLLMPLSADAGTLYIPYATNAEVHGYQVETRLLVANEGLRPRGFTALFIPAGSDGSALDRTGLQRFFVSPVSLRIFDRLVPEGTTGMLEITGAPQLSVTAEIVLVRGTERIPLASVPKVLPKDGVALVPGRRIRFHAAVDYTREAATLGLANLSSDSRPAPCALAVIKDEPIPAGGVGRGANIPGTSLSLLEVEDLFAGLPSTLQPSGRVDMQCAQSGLYFPFVVIFDRDRPGVRFVEHLGRSTLGAGF